MTNQSTINFDFRELIERKNENKLNASQFFDIVDGIAIKMKYIEIVEVKIRNISQKLIRYKGFSYWFSKKK